VLDTVIALRRPENYSPEQGARFEVHFEKLRHRVGELGQPFEASAEPVSLEEGRSGIAWVSRELTPPLLNEAAALFEEARRCERSRLYSGSARARPDGFGNGLWRGLLGRGGGGKEQPPCPSVPETGRIAPRQRPRHEPADSSLPPNGLTICG
jgi:hypothetical protein